MQKYFHSLEVFSLFIWGKMLKNVVWRLNHVVGNFPTSFTMSYLVPQASAGKIWRGTLISLVIYIVMEDLGIKITLISMHPFMDYVLC